MPICCVIRPPHRLGGVARVAPLSGYREPSIWAFLSSLRKIFLFSDDGVSPKSCFADFSGHYIL